ncbi:MAG: endonuclease/exonuclease/phosphatase family protein [Kineosporiaceae bacterium]|nr:endonuclease/exonuclease/phosphatase family protein [Kineosporiaceae bacterium]
MRPTGITVATLNLYLGADLAPLFAAGQSEALASRTATVWSAVEASRPAERMTAAATQLVRYLPDVVALQEAGRWQAGTTEHPRIHDLLTFFLDALAAQGTPYRVVSEGAGFSSATMSATLASATGQFVELYDRTAILVRDDPAVQASNPQQGRYRAALRAAVLGHPLEVTRGWCAADVQVGRVRLHVINTHLESYDAPTRIAQAHELATEVVHPPDTRPPTIVLGDLNCRPPRCRPVRETMPVGAREVSGDAYEVLSSVGLLDAWTRMHPKEHCLGFTSGHAADLRNPVAEFDHRIDYVFTDGSMRVCHAHVTGDQPEDRTASGLWPSDHGFLVVGLEV